MDLLHSFNLLHDCDPLVYTPLSSPPQASGSTEEVVERLKVPHKLARKPPQSGGIVYLLFNEGQDSYSDGYLSTDIFGLSSSRMVVSGGIAPSYGSLSGRPVADTIGTPLALHVAAYISLWPTAKSVSLLLNRSEFDDVVKCFEHPVALDVGLQDLIFKWTVGHVGAVIEILKTISHKVCPPPL
jgi:hypothetical protein